MNSALRTWFGWRLDGVGKRGFGFLYRGHRVHGRPRQSHHNMVSVRHLAVADTGHDAIARSVLGESVYVNLWSCKWLGELFFFHGTPPQLGGALLSTNPSHVRHKKYMPCDSFSLDRLNFSSAHQPARRRLPAFPPLPWLMSAAALTQARVA